MSEEETKFCKYCKEPLEDGIAEGLGCSECGQDVHMKCLKSGGAPGGLNGDVFFTIVCQECSLTGKEIFTREKISWLKIVILVLYHLQTRSPGLGKKGFFHWRNHIAALIDQNWETIFTSEVKRKRKWIGTVAGTLSHFNQFFFKSGTAVVNEPAWWALIYPKLTPHIISNIYNDFTLEKHRLKAAKLQVPDRELFQKLLAKHVTNRELLPLENDGGTSQPLSNSCRAENNKRLAHIKSSYQMRVNNKRLKTLLPTFDSTSKKLVKQETNLDIPKLGDESTPEFKDNNGSPKVFHTNDSSDAIRGETTNQRDNIMLLDPMCHYNTSLNLSSLSKQRSCPLKTKLFGGLRQELVLSPYSGIYLKPYIRRDTDTFPPWLRLMYELQAKTNQTNPDYVLPPRAPLDYTYVQPEHIPAINSLCNNFFWPGIDLTESLQYPDFSCVVLYRKLIVAFAFLVPNVKYTENYISFVFTRPGWRNAGIGQFMLYHLIQTSLGKDITLHVSINNSALFLYQKFGFKVESVVLYFYDKYIHNETKESKHAFFCRLER